MESRLNFPAASASSSKDKMMNEPTISDLRPPDASAATFYLPPFLEDILELSDVAVATEQKNHHHCRELGNPSPAEDTPARTCEGIKAKDHGCFFLFEPSLPPVTDETKKNKTGTTFVLEPESSSSSLFWLSTSFVVNDSADCLHVSGQMHHHNNDNFDCSNKKSLQDLQEISAAAMFPSVSVAPGCQSSKRDLVDRIAMDDTDKKRFLTAPQQELSQTRTAVADRVKQGQMIRESPRFELGGIPEEIFVCIDQEDDDISALDPEWEEVYEELPSSQMSAFQSMQVTFLSTEEATPTKTKSFSPTTPNHLRSTKKLERYESPATTVHTTGISCPWSSPEETLSSQPTTCFPNSASYSLFSQHWAEESESLEYGYDTGFQGSYDEDFQVSHHYPSPDRHLVFGARDPSESDCIKHFDTIPA